MRVGSGFSALRCDDKHLHMHLRPNSGGVAGQPNLCAYMSRCGVDPLRGRQFSGSRLRSPLRKEHESLRKG